MLFLISWLLKAKLQFWMRWGKWTARGLLGAYAYMYCTRSGAMFVPVILAAVLVLAVRERRTPLPKRRRLN